MFNQSTMRAVHSALAPAPAPASSSDRRPSTTPSSGGEVPVTPASASEGHAGPEYPQPASFYTHEHNVKQMPLPMYEDDGESVASGSGASTGAARHHRPRWLSPKDDPEVTRGIPVFEPTMDEFADFEGYMEKICPWGEASGIVKVVPPKEWTDALPALQPRALAALQIRKPIEQEMQGKTGEYRQYNIEQRKRMSLKDWFEKCGKPGYKGPGPKDASLSSRREKAPTKTPAKRTRRTRAEMEADAEAAAAAEAARTATQPPAGHAAGSAGPSRRSGAGVDRQALPCKREPPSDIVMEQLLPADEAVQPTPTPSTPGFEIESGPADHGSGAAISLHTPSTPGFEVIPQSGPAPAAKVEAATEDEPIPTPDQVEASQPEDAVKPANQAETHNNVAELDPFFETFQPRSSWLADGTKDEDYTPEACKELERNFWRGCSARKPWYGADLRGSLFTNETKTWNVAHLPNILDRAKRKIDGVNTPYLYFGMWAAAFAWHVEDMDLFSINYIHFGSPKHWYAIPNKKAERFEGFMKRTFALDASRCSQFLRHKAFTVSPQNLANNSLRPNTLVQKQGEFVITYPRGYHAGFNLGFNCAESLNFLLMDWVENVRKAERCNCADDSVRIDIDAILREAAAQDSTRAAKEEKERLRQVRLANPAAHKRERKKTETPEKPAKRMKLLATRPEAVATLSPRPAPAREISRPCVLCPDPSEEGLLRIVGAGDALRGRYKNDSLPLAHQGCAEAIPELWIDLIGVENMRYHVVKGVETMDKARWKLKCSACPPSLSQTGAKVQCTKGKCLRAYHPSCAKTSSEVLYTESAAVEYVLHRTLEGLEQIVPVNTFKTQLLCPKHNPAVQEAIKEAKDGADAAALRGRILSMPLRSRVKGRFPDGGPAETTLVGINEVAETVDCVHRDGTIRTYPWKKLNLELLAEQPPPTPTPLRMAFDRPLLSTADDRAQKYADRSAALEPAPPLATPVYGATSKPLPIDLPRTTVRGAFRPW